MAARVRRFVVGLDHSELGMIAVDRAIADAAEQLAEMHVVFAYQPLGDATNLYAGPADPAMDYELERLTPHVRERVEKYSPDAPHVIFHGVIGGTADALVTTTAVLDADMIYVGTHGRTDLSRTFIESVAEKIARIAKYPMTIVREQDHERSLRWPKHHREINMR